MQKQINFHRRTEFLAVFWRKGGEELIIAKKKYREMACIEERASAFEWFSRVILSKAKYCLPG